MIPDAHCHLADLPDPGASIDAAWKAGVGPILGVAMAPADAEVVMRMRDLHPGGVLAGVGLHPSRVPGLTDAQIDAEIGILEGRAADADFIGEIGLDFKDATDAAQQARQRETLVRLLEVAAAAGRPVNLHTRRADRLLVSTAAEFTRRTGIAALLHWFTHSIPLAAECARAGLYISAGPSILSDPLQADVARAIDGDLLLVETDSPVVYAGAAARPDWAVRVAGRLAALRGETPDEMAARLSRNLARYLGRLTPSGGG